MLETNSKELMLLSISQNWISSIAFFNGSTNFYAATENGLLKALRAFFQTCREYGLKVHALKTNVFMKEATFCGRIFNENVMRFHPSRFETLATMQRPAKACDLLQFTSALNWKRTNIPNYAEIVSPLHNLLESCYTRAGGRTKSKTATHFRDPSGERNTPPHLRR
jgi:hypothetical protein